MDPAVAKEISESKQQKAATERAATSAVASVDSRPAEKSEN